MPSDLPIPESIGGCRVVATAPPKWQGYCVSRGQEVAIVSYAIAFSEKESAYHLFALDAGWDILADISWKSIDNARYQAQFEAGIGPGDWNYLSEP